ncbi:bifunctional 3'-5' exonuclease/DNA polymerase [Microbacterium sp. Bi121]|uniref:bifunctional 3'-5' exonuclease/DNA polymerase n=1 Tax=Microbacterium sp. Bi121 TaxID=2822348 RepID=UPI001D357275|nr:bifunctional 3'-5' exonuclease/DNA polymerase [Microbacterium sp. Bi121]CAH0158041.1 DNA polymerase I, thermostable [Microbacterium sp. Bi121]
MSTRPAADSRILLAEIGSAVIAVRLAPDGAALETTDVPAAQVAEWVGRVEVREHPRWVIRSARELYPPLLMAGVQLTKTHDLLLCHAILRDTDVVARPLAPSPEWLPHEPAAGEPALFDADDRSTPESVDELLEQYQAQQRVIDSDRTGRLALLCAAESAGGLVAEEMRAGGLPWDAAEHERILTEVLGARPSGGGMPAHMATHADAVRFHLGDPGLHLDSHVKLLRALHRVGVNVESTSQWEISEISHPVIAPLLAYKKLSRLMSANGWAWLTEWVREGRFRPVYIPGGVVTGRWASSGGGALQVPRMLRPAVRADPGWMLVVADVAQLEPRMLAAMASDKSMAEAARGQDLYAGVVASGAVATREEAKYAVLGAMYGATTGDSGRLVPRLRKVYPRAMHRVDEAARLGEDGGVVSTWLGRSSPKPDADWRAQQAAATGADVDPADVKRARARARDRGRFTRNFVVQGTAAEWALIWLAEIRHRLRQLPEAETPAPASGPFARHAHLAFFLHDEVILHVPAEQADAAASAVREAAAVATRRLFGTFPIDVPLDLRIVHTAEK